MHEVNRNIAVATTTTKDVPNGNSIVRVRAQVMMRDDSTGGWVPMGGGGLSNVSVQKRKIHHAENDQPCKHEYIIYGRRISDQTVVLSCTVKKDFEYNKVMPTFHHWKTGNKKFGLTFQTAADARAFDKGVRLAIEDLLSGNYEVTPLHRQYSVANDLEDDDVFMQLDLPVEKSRGDVGWLTNDSDRQRSLSSPGMEMLAPPHHSPIDTGSTTIVTVPPKAQGKQHHHHASSGCSGCGRMTKHHLSRPSMHMIASTPSSVSKNLSESLLAVQSDSSGGGTDIHSMMQFICSKKDDKKLSDKDYSYVKFLTREPVHEYSYPKLVDYVASTTTTSMPYDSSNAKTIPHGLPSRNTAVVEDEPNPVSSMESNLPWSRSSSARGVILNRHNNNGSRYKQQQQRSSQAKHMIHQRPDLKPQQADESLPSESVVCNDEKSSSLVIRRSGSSLSSACSPTTNAGGSGGKSSKKILSVPHPLFSSKFKRGSSSSSKFNASKDQLAVMYARRRNDLRPSLKMYKCVHCRESFSNDAGRNRRGDCAFAPNRIRKGIETVTCLSCAKCLHYHCMSDSESDYVHPCDCSNADGHCVRRWIGLSLLAVLVPCLLCYLPLMSCFACGEKCRLCGGRHEAVS